MRQVSCRATASANTTSPPVDQDSDPGCSLTAGIDSQQGLHLATASSEDRVVPSGSLPLLAQTGGWRSGRACPFWPGISDINLFRYCQGVIDLDAEISILVCPSKSWTALRFPVRR